MRVVRRYSTFIANGFRFHTVDRARARKTQNSGVLVRGDDLDSEKEYYGVLEDIYELCYISNKKVFLFKCHWWDVGHLGRGYKVDKFGVTSVNAHCSLATNEPFVLATQAEQVFYLNDIVDPNWLVVMKTNPRDLFNMPEVGDDDVVEDDSEILYNEAYQQDDVSNNIVINAESGIDLVVCLFRDDVEPVRISRSNEQPATSQERAATGVDDFINDDDDDDVSMNEASEEELLEDADTDDTDNTDQD